MDDFRKIVYRVLIGLVLMLVVWISFLAFRGCGFNLNCAAGPAPEYTSIPTLVPATMPTYVRLLGAATVAGTTSGGTTEPEPTEEVARPSNAGGTGPAIALTGDPKSGQQVYAASCEVCHGKNGTGGIANAGSADGTVPPLNPIDSTLMSSDHKTYATNLDLFIEHGSTPEGSNPTFSMPAWGDKSLLTPQQIADVIAYVISLNK